MDGISEVAATVVCFAFGTHAYSRHRSEMSKLYSTRRVLFWLYSAGFLILGAGTLMQSLVRMQLPSLDGGFRFDFAAFILAASYAAILFGVWSYDRDYTARHR